MFSKENLWICWSVPMTEKKPLNPNFEAFMDELAQEVVNNLNRNVLKEAEIPLPLPKNLPSQEERFATIKKDWAKREQAQTKENDEDPEKARTLELLHLALELEYAKGTISKEIYNGFKSPI